MLIGCLPILNTLPEAGTEEPGFSCAPGKKQHKARSELIRQACLSYLQQLKHEELDRLYQQGYMRIPEKPEMGEVQVTMSGEFMSKESW